MNIVGHRGAKGLAPENSIESIRKALEEKVDMIEIDIRMQNSKLVLSHDKTDTEQVYCPLTQALEEIEGKIPIILDIKESAVINKMLETLKEYEGKIIYSSLKFGTLQKISNLIPKAELAVIEKWSGVRAVASASLLGIKKLHLNHKWLWENYVLSLKNQGFEVYAYTVNDLGRANELKQWGVDGIITDYPNHF